MVLALLSLKSASYMIGCAGLVNVSHSQLTVGIEALAEARMASMVAASSTTKRLPSGINVEVSRFPIQQAFDLILLDPIFFSLQTF